MKIEGQVAIVTGGTSGLGAETARHLAERGAHVAVFDLQAGIPPEGGSSHVVDVTSSSAVEAALANLCAGPGAPRILVNCAGIGLGARVVGKEGPMALETFQKVVSVNLFGTFNMIRLIAARMMELDPLETGERGTIVNTASVAAYDGQIGQAAYSASKGAIVSMALPIAREFARSGIRVNTIAPGIFRTPLLDTLPDEAQQALAASIPFPSRLGEPAEFAALVEMLLTNAYINAETIRIDGAVRLAPK